MKNKYTDKQKNELSFFLAAGHTAKEAQKKFGMSASYIHQFKSKIKNNLKSLPRLDAGQSITVKDGKIKVTDSSDLKKGDVVMINNPDQNLIEVSFLKVENEKLRERIESLLKVMGILISRI